MPRAWRITDWEKHYEIDESGRPLKPGRTAKRKGLTFVRHMVFGPEGDNRNYRLAAAVADEKYGPGCWCIAFGVFNKLLEIAAKGPREWRGWILDAKRKPMEIPDLMLETCFSRAQLQQGLAALSDPQVGWLERKAFPPRKKRDRVKAPKPAENGDSPPPSRTVPETETKTDTQTQSETSPPSPVAGQAEAPASPRQPACAGRSPPRTKLRATVQALAMHLRVSLNKRTPQGRADLKCLVVMARHLLRGDLGDPEAARKGAYAKATDATAPGIQKPLAWFQAWFKEQLAAHGGRKWSDFT